MRQNTRAVCICLFIYSFTLATVIVWGLFSSTILTIVMVPVFYRIFVPALPAPDMEEEDELGVGSGSVEPEAHE